MDDHRTDDSGLSPLEAVHKKITGSDAANLTADPAPPGVWDRIRLARHDDRPYTLDFINNLFTGFTEIHGDRRFADDPAIVAGFASLNGDPCVVIGHQKGRTTKQRMHRNFGMPK